MDPQGNPQDPQTNIDPTQNTTPNPGGMQPPQDQGQGAQPSDQTAANDEKDLQDFLNSTPPPEPRGSAYKGTSGFQDFSTIITLLVHPATTFDEKYFLYLFSGSLSLNLTEKKDIMAKIPSLSQFQIDELIKILEEEKQKFDLLGEKHPDEVKKLRNEALSAWQMYEMEQTKTTQVSGDQAKADEIRKSLGL